MIICQFTPKIQLKQPIADMSSQVSNQLPTMTLASHEGKLVMLDWQTYKAYKVQAYFATKLGATDPQFIQEADLNPEDNEQKLIINVITQINEFLAGRRKAFEIDMDLSIGTLFQQKVWQALLQIPYGETISYAELAQRIGQPTAYRAVANANGKNPIALIIPCHRVIASDGGLGGYTGGVAIKRQLLMIENLLS